MNFIEQMFILQKQLNDNTNGDIWLTGKTKEGRQIDWHRCIYMEAAEAIDSFNWKHWKNINIDNDWDNIKVELIDIWHFIMSEAIIKDLKEYANKYENNSFNTEIDEDSLLKDIENILNLSIKASIDKSFNPIKEIIDLFFSAIKNIGISVEELYKRYVVKNKLNYFRQQNGYKKGQYIKIWNGVEDNVFAFDIMDKNPRISPSEFYQKLEAAYKNIT